MAELLMLTLEPIKSLKIEEYALYSQIMLKNRGDLYLMKQQERDHLITKYVRKLAAEVFGLEYRAQYKLSLLGAVDSIASFINLLEVAFMVVTFFLGLLSVLLIYSLMMSVI